MPILAFYIWMVVYSIWANLCLKWLDNYPDWVENIAMLLGIPLCALISVAIAIKISGEEPKYFKNISSKNDEK